MQAPTITLTTDFGTADGYIAAVKGVLLSRAPEAQIIDLSHEIPAGDIRAAAGLLRRAVPYFPTRCVHLVVVDPGVGGDREILAVDHTLGRFVGPDNGVLDAFLDTAEVVEIARPDLYLEARGSTFHGRDRMAPVAAALAGGTAVDDLGAEAGSPVRLEPLPLERSDTTVHGSVEHIDRFGNVITNIPWRWVEALPPKACTWIGDRPVCRRVTHYAELPEDKPGFLCGSEGTLELARNRASLATAWDLQVGTPVTVSVGGRPS